MLPLTPRNLMRNCSSWAGLAMAANSSSAWREMTSICSNTSAMKFSAARYVLQID